MNTFYRVLGLMSGTSLDGLDIAQCTFEKKSEKWSYSIERAITYPYSSQWKQKLTEAETLPGIDLLLLHNEYGRFTGELVNQFIKEHNVKIDFIASHGQTIFHQPHKGLTLQIGNGADILATTGITTVCDFRALDVAYGGQGAPLVPIGDEFLFGDYDFCLNLGGFANISYKTAEGKRVAFDICPVNILINHFVKKIDLDYDIDGAIGRKGSISAGLLNELNILPVYQQSGPRSFGKEWVWNDVLPVIDKHKLSLEDTLRTVYEHVAIRIEQSISKKPGKTILITGGGTHNKFLLEVLQKHISLKTVIPSDEIIDFKEALIFAFLGVLRTRNEVNCLCSVTGAKIDNIGGIIFKATR
jgi:anhydro-N-acetylmuramic acid kinase